ncbi:MAG: efflux RND transporter periplasmic adaptor subunit [Desulfotomaculales bacterium]
MRRRRVFLAALCGGVLLVVVVVASVYRAFHTPGTEVKTAVAEERIFEDKVLVTGRVEVLREVVLVAPFAARLLRLHVGEGDPVVPGQVLAEMDTTEVEERVAEARAALAVAEAELARGLRPGTPQEIAQAEAALEAAEKLAEVARNKRERYLYLREQGAVSPAECEQVEAEYARAQAELEAAAARLAALRQADPQALAVLRARVDQARVVLENALKAGARGRLTAPEEGRVLRVAAREGEYLAAGTLVLSVGNAEHVRVVADLTEQEAAGIAPGQEAEVHWIGRPDRAWPARVARVAPAVTPGRDRPEERVVRVYLDLAASEAGPLPGATVDVFIYRIKPRQALLVPADAVRRADGERFVFAVREGVARRTPVTVGGSNELYTEVLAGLKPGDRVILEPKDLRDGQPVREAGGKRL